MPARELADALGISPVYIVYGRSGLVNLAKKCKLAFMPQSGDFTLNALI